MNKRVTTLLAAAIISSGLTACLPLVASGVAASAMVASDRRTSGAYVEDQSIELKATRLAAERFAAAHIDITSYNRGVLITGEARDEAQRQAIELMVRAQPGVQRVFNHMVIAAPSSLAERTNDTVLTTKVRARLQSGTGYAPQAIKVVSDRGTVYLLGLVTAGEADAATEVVARTAGVQRVVKLFELISPAAAGSN